MISQKSAKFFGTVVSGLIENGKVPLAPAQPPMSPREQPRQPKNEVEVHPVPKILQPNRRRSQSLNAISTMNLDNIPPPLSRFNKRSPTNVSSPGFNIVGPRTPPPLPGSPKPALQPKSTLLRKNTLVNMGNLNTYPGPKRAQLSPQPQPFTPPPTNGTSSAAIAMGGVQVLPVLPKQRRGSAE